MTKRKRIYLAYLESGHWKALRLAARIRDGHKCVKCGSDKNLQGHHKHYRKDFRLCTVDDIETLCKKCHEKHHKDKKAERRLRRTERRLCRTRIGYLIAEFSSA